MVRECLGEYFGFAENMVTVHRTMPVYFIAHFSRQERPGDGAEHALAGSCPVRATVASLEQTVHAVCRGLSLPGARRDEGDPSTCSILRHCPDDSWVVQRAGGDRKPRRAPGSRGEREMFVAAWCAHPDLIPDLSSSACANEICCFHMNFCKTSLNLKICDNAHLQMHYWCA